MFRFTQEPSLGSLSQCLAKIIDMVPAYLLICFVASAMAAYYAAIALATHISTSTVEPYL